MVPSNKISIVLPTYNGSDYIKQSIVSCLKQTHQNIELIIVDDCSTDKTFEIINSFKDSRIKIIRNNKNSGVSFSLNKGFSQATGEFLTWTSDDNYYLENALERMLYCLKNSKSSFVYSNYFVLIAGEDSKDTAAVKSFPDIRQIKNTCVVGPCFLYKREVQDQIGGYDCELTLGADYDYWLRVYEKFQIIHLDEALYYYRVHPKSLTGSNIIKYDMYIETVLIWLRYGTFSVESAYYGLVNYIIEIIKAKRANETKSGNKLMTDRDFIVDYIIDEKILFNSSVLKGIQSCLNNFFYNNSGFKITKKSILKLIEKHESMLQKITTCKDIFGSITKLLDAEQKAIMFKAINEYLLKNKNQSELKEFSGLVEKNKALEKKTGSNIEMTEKTVRQNNSKDNLFSSEIKLRSTLAVCMIVKNEEKNISRCLESVRTVADEIIVVDTGSKDKTCLVAESYGAKIKKYTWNENFSEARNYSIENVKSDWIFFLDADEVLENQSIGFLKSLSVENKPKAYYVKILSMRSEMSEEVLVEHYTLRLWNNKFGFEFVGEIHEQLMINNSKEYEKLLSPVELRHYGYTKKSIESGKKYERNYDILLKAIENEPENAFNYHNMGVNLYVAGQNQEAIEYFDKTIDILNKAGCSASYHPFCLCYKSSCYALLGNYSKAISEAKLALKLVPDFKDAYFNLAAAYYFNGEFKKAIRNYNNAIEAKESVLIGGCVDKSVGSWGAYNGLGLTYLKISDYKKAQEYLEKAYLLQKKSVKIIINLAVLYKTISDVKKIEDLLTDVRDLFFNVEQAQQLTNILLDFKRYESAIKFLTGALAQYDNSKIKIDENGFKISLLIKGIADVYSAKGEYEKAIPYYERALKENEKNDIIYNGLGLCYLRLKNYSNGAQYFSKAIDFNNQDPSYFSNLGNCLSEMGRLEDAEIAYNCALLLNPDYLPAAFGIESVKIYKSLNIQKKDVLSG